MLRRIAAVAGLSLVAAASTLRADDAKARFDDTRDVPHGVVAQVEYDSPAVDGKRPLVVYTPPGYEANKDHAKYPVLYLLHGSGDDQTGWDQKGLANLIFDNLISEHKAIPMIVVMPHGYVVKKGAAVPRSGEERRKAVDGLEDDLVSNVIPYVEKHYSILNDRDHRAVAGLSMGGYQTLLISGKHLDLFAWVGAFSSGGRKDFFNDSWKTQLAGPEEANKQLKLLWISCGDKDPLLPVNQAIDKALTDAKITHIWHEDTGKHEWPVWKNDLHEFAQLVFKEKA